MRAMARARTGQEPDMLTSQQFTAIAVGIVVLFGLIFDGMTRYVLLGGTAMVLAASLVLGDGFGLTVILNR
jgi:hypothetical protein